jgi:recombination protein RecR
MATDAPNRALQDLVAQFERLPGIGRKTAERLAYHVLRAPAEEALLLADAIRSVKQSLRSCTRCFHISDGDLCGICADPGRDPTLICVVEQPKDVFAIEKTGAYRGLYHVLQGAFAPLEGVGPEDLTIEKLVERVREEGERPVEEVIVATNPDFEGEGTALLVRQKLGALPRKVKLTRIARGVPSGSRIEHVGTNIVADALEGRREMS